MKKFFGALLALIIAWFESEQNSTETDLERTDRMAGSNFWL